jgi:Mrp family chromosome partitioning ATPase/uncharacterized protein involved in exopolysaccharide biosynthesis
MSQDITLAPNRNMPVRPEDVWGGGHSAGNALGMYQPQAQQQQPFKKIHRLLRGRYWLAIALGIVGAAIGGFIGFGSQVPLYAADALVEISPRMPSLSAADKAMPFYQQFLKSQQQIIVSHRTITAAMQTDEWKAVSNRKPSQEFISAFANNLTADLIKDSQLIRVSFQHENPKVAAAAVNAVVAAYLKISFEENGKVSRERLDQITQRRDESQTAYRKNNELLREVLKENNTDTLSNLLAQQQAEELKIEGKISEAELQLAMINASKNAGASSPQLAIAPEDLVPFDPTIKAYLQRIQDMKDRLAQLEIDLLPNHPTVQKNRTMLAQTEQQMKQYFDSVKHKYLDLQVGGNGNTVAITPRTIEWMKNNVIELKKVKATWHEKVVATAAQKMESDKYKDEMDKCKEDINKYEKTIEALEFQLAMSGNIRQISQAIEPISPAKDARKQFALMGLAMGGGIPIGLLLLIGLLDSRYRYSDDAGGSSMNGLPLLGILPNLPDRLSDPGQASIAAHCVHQIRTMLQLNNVMPKSAFSVTSSASGDGKTSLTLALGLSFAASGQRTLLIDSDLVGAGLTTRLGMNGPEGILEAMTSGDLMRFVKNTDVADLSMLPVGLAQLHHAGIFSPAAVRRLLTEAKKHFEVILIDTGPVLGSIEATPVCAAADGVILTVARGQQRPLVEKALSHLQSIGARIAGIVFNKAMTRDFEQSISGISMRSAARSTSAANGNGRVQREGAGQLGPVAKAVHHSVKGETVEKN